MKLLTLSLLAVSASVLSSCSHRVADYTVCSTKNMDLNSMNGYRTETNQRCTGKDVQHIVIFFPTKQFISWKDPVDDAIESAGKDCVGLSNVVVEQGGWYIPFIYGQNWVKVDGDPIYKK